MKRILIVLYIISLSISANGQIKYEWKTATAAGYTYRFVTNDPSKTRFYTLKNGLTVMLTENHETPRVVYRMAVRSGSNNDPRDHTGLAHYLEHLLFKGTDQFGTLDWANEKPLLDKIEDLYEQYNSTADIEKRKEIYKEIDKVSGEAAKFSIAGEYSKMVKALGSQGTNAHTSVEETIYEEDIPSNAIDKLLAIQAERFRNPVIRIFHTELEAVYEEKNRGLDNDANKMQEAMLSSVFPTHNYGVQTTIGTIEHLKNPSIKAIKEFYKKYYVPNNMGLIMAGDFDADQLIQKINKSFSYMQQTPFDEYKGTIEAPINGPVIREVFGPTSENMRIAYRTAPAGTRESMLTGLISSILSNSSAGLLDLRLNKQQKVLGAGAGFWQFKDYGILFLTAAPKQGQSLDNVKDLLLEQVNALKAGDFDESLVKAIVANYKLSRLQSLDNNLARASNVLDDFIKSKGANWDKSVAEIDELNKVSKKELVEFANKLLSSDNYVQLYKRKGEDKNHVKVDKPLITPVETNPTKTSAFAKNILESKLPSVKPVWLDYSKDLKKGKLGNAEVLYVQNKTNSIFRLTYRIEVGSWNNKLLPVAARYLQYLGTDKMSSEDISKQFFNLACDFNINPGAEQTTITISGLQENFEKAVKLFEDILTQCKPDENALAGLKNNLQKSRANSKLNKVNIANALQSYAMYGAKNPFNNVLTNEELQAIQPGQLTDLLHSLTKMEHKVMYYGPESMNILVAKLNSIHKIPASWQRNTEPLKFERVKQNSNQVLFSNYDAVQSEIYWVRNLEQYDPKLEAVVNVFNSYFGGGMGSVVFSTIRESKALAYATYATVATPLKKDDEFAVVAYVGCQADKMNEAINGMNELLKVLPQTEQGFENAKASMKKNTETDRITKDGIINSYLNAKRKGIDYDIRKENYAKYSSIQFDDIHNYHQQHLVGQPYTYCVVASEKKINMDDLKKLGEVKILKLEELFGY